MPSTYEPIATQTWTSNQASITFNSISSAYTDLVLQGSILGYFTTGTYTECGLRFNGDTASNYSATTIYGDGSTATSARASNQSNGISRFYIPAESSDTGTRGTINISIQNYTNTTTFKTALIRSGGGNRVTSAAVGLWRKTPEAITSITLDNRDSATGFIAGTLTLYGIKAA